jgi:hypothetical protein
MGPSDECPYGSKPGRRYPGPHPAGPEGHAGTTARSQERRRPEEGAIRDWRPGDPDTQLEPEGKPIVLAERTHLADQGGRP